MLDIRKKYERDFKISNLLCSNIKKNQADSETHQIEIVKMKTVVTEINEIKPQGMV